MMCIERTLRSTPAGRQVAERAVRRHRLAEVRLVELMVGATARVVRIDERLEVQPGMLESLEHGGVIPGVQVTLVQVTAAGERVVRGPRRSLHLPADVAADVFVIEGDLATISDAVARSGWGGDR